MPDEYPPFIGNIEAHKKFIETYPTFCAALPGIGELTSQIISNPNVEDADRDRKAANVLMVELAALSFEDFDEVVLLCANDHPRGALKILRGLFERSVTLFEIDEDTKNARLFYDYNFIDRYKIAREMEEAYPGQFFTKEKLAEIKAARDAVIDSYGGKAPISWMPSGIVAVAKKRGFGGSYLIHAYYNALNETHPKMEAIFYRQRMREDPSRADDTPATLQAAHFFLLQNVTAMKERFRMNDLEELYQKCVEEYRQAWPPAQRPG